MRARLRCLLPMRGAMLNTRSFYPVAALVLLCKRREAGCLLVWEGDGWDGTTPAADKASLLWSIPRG
jgi:hypothetical protein